MDVKSSNPNRNPNPNPCSPKLAFHFLTALARINQTTATSSCPPSRRSQTIRLAAYASMARVAGPRRAWSRALLRRLLRRRRRFPPTRRAVLIRRRLRVASWTSPRDQTDDLRRVVPGGKAMDLCSLLEETADYIQSLTAQVQLMQAIVDSTSH